MNDILTVLKMKNRFMTAREISESVNISIQAVNRKLKNMSRTIEMKKRIVKIGNRTAIRPVRFYRWKR